MNQRTAFHDGEWDALGSSKFKLSGMNQARCARVVGSLFVPLFHCKQPAGTRLLGLDAALSVGLWGEALPERCCCCGDGDGGGGGGGVVHAISRGHTFFCQSELRMSSNDALGNT